jgi:hypothetical protein
MPFNFRRRFIIVGVCIATWLSFAGSPLNRNHFPVQVAIFYPPLSMQSLAVYVFTRLSASTSTSNDLWSCSSGFISLFSYIMIQPSSGLNTLATSKINYDPGEIDIIQPNAEYPTDSSHPSFYFSSIIDHSQPHDFIPEWKHAHCALRFIWSYS